MAFPTITEMYEEVDFKRFIAVIGVASHLLSPNARNISYDYRMGAAPTCSFTIDNPAPAYLIKDASVQVWVGFNNATKMVFNGTIESVSPTESGIVVQCTGQSKKLDAPYFASITETDGTDVNVLISDLLDLANVFSYTVDLPAWTPGLISPQPLQFSTWAEAINKLAEPFGSPFYEMPNGYIRVDTRDPIPGPTPFRTYFSGVLTDGSYAQPAAVTAVNPDALPRIQQISLEQLSRDVRNRIVVRGADIPGVGGEGEAISAILETVAFGPSPWIPPVNGVDQFVEMIFQNEFLDDADDLAAVALRFFNVWNRLYERVNLTVDGDPEIFLGATVSVIDLGYTRLNSKYVVMGYSCNISSSGFTTSLELQGGRSAGVVPSMPPWAFFVWTNMNVPIAPFLDVNGNNSQNTAPNAAKIRQFIPNEDPEMPDPEDPGQDPADPGDDGQRVIVTFDGSPSVDPDGRIVSWDWSVNTTPVQTASGKRVTMLFNPGDDQSVEMTLTVTDNSGLTDSITQTVNVNTFGPSDGYGDEDDTGTTEDPSAGGGDLNIPVIFVSLENDGIAATVPGDGGSTFNIHPAPAYFPRGVVAVNYKETGDLVAIWVGTAAIISTSYLQVAPTFVSFGGDFGVGNDIVGTGPEFSAVMSDGTDSWVLRTDDWGETWTQQASKTGEVFYRISGNYILGGRGIWVLGEDGSITPFDPDQEAVTPWISEPNAYILVDDEHDAILIPNRLIVSPNTVFFDGTGMTLGTGIEVTPDFVKVLQGEEFYHGLASSGHIFDGDLTNTWTDMSPASNGLTDPRDFIQEQGMDGVFLAAYAGGVAKTVDYGVIWRKLALRASGVLTIEDDIEIGDEMTIGSKTYTFVDSMDFDMDGEIAVDGDIVAAINGTDGVNDPHEQVTAESGDGGYVIRAIVPGTAGDGIATTSMFTNPGNFFDAATLGAKVARIGLKIPVTVTNGDTFTIEGKVYTIVGSDADMDGEVLNGTLDVVQANIVAAINGTDGHNVAHTIVTAQDFLADIAIISTIEVVPPGSTIDNSETFTSADNVFVAGSATASELVDGIRLQAVNVPQTAPTADLYGITDTD